MKYMLSVLLSLSASGLVGCAHGSMKAPSLDDTMSAAQGDVDAQAGDLTEAAGGQVTDVKAQANAKAAEAQSKAASMAGVSNTSMSKAIAVELLRRMPLISDSKSLVYANTVGQFVAQELVPSLKCKSDGTGATEVRVAIVKSSTPTSFSLPGGMIFVTTALMQKMTTEDELAGVLANEMVLSICEKGVAANLAQQAATGWSDFILTLPTKSMSRNDLAFADRYALVTLYRRGYDVLPYVTFVAKSESSGRHMYGVERAAVLQKSIAKTKAITPTASARSGRFLAAKAKAN